MVGGAGNDIYFVDNAGDAMSRIRQRRQRYGVRLDQLHHPANIESLILHGGSGFCRRRQRREQRLVGNSGANNLDGGAGADFLSGNGGNDTFQFQPVRPTATWSPTLPARRRRRRLLQFLGFGTAARGRPSPRSARPTSGRSTRGWTPTTRSSRSQNGAAVHASDFLFV